MSVALSSYGLRLSHTALALAVYLASPGAVSAEDAWQPFGLQGSEVRALAAAPGLLCAGLVGGGVHCLELANPGFGWVSAGLDGMTVQDLWVDPTAPDRRFAAIPSGGLFRTLDGGASWLEVGDMVRVHGVPGSSTVYAARGGVFRSDDGGDTWEELLDWSVAYYRLDVSPSNPDIIWVGGETPIFSGYLLRSLDGGANWDIVWDSLDIGDNATWDIAAHPTIASVALTGNEGFLQRTTDTGQTFQRVLERTYIPYVAWDAVSEFRAYAAHRRADDGAFVSHDYGATWEEISTGLGTLTVWQVEADRARYGLAYVATSDGVLRYHEGESWICLSAALGLDQVELLFGPCSPAGVQDPLVGDVVAGLVEGLQLGEESVDLQGVACLVENGSLSLAELDVPDPQLGLTLFLLARQDGAVDYGPSSSGAPRLPSLGDCTP